MRVVQLTPGAGGMYCGNCLRDNALVAALRALGHDVLMVPLYLPLTLDEQDQSAGTPIFFGGLNVYLEQKSAWFRSAPPWLHKLLASPRLLKWAAGRAAKTQPVGLGELTLSMLQGEEGRQARELDELLGWLKQQPKPDIIFLSNALLLGMARRLQAELQTPVVCMLQGEDWFLDALPEPHRTKCWKTLAARAAELPRLVAPSRYFAERMGKRLALSPERVAVVYNGIQLEGYSEPAQPPNPAAPVLGYFTRMCPEKGLDKLVEAFVLLRRRGRFPRLKLRAGGGCGPGDEPFVNGLRSRLAQADLLSDVEFCPNLDRAAKIAFLRSLSVFCVPAMYGEAFGLYVVEALAAGVPVVQPRSGAFPELLEGTGGGVLCEPGDPQGLAVAIEELLSEPQRARDMAERGRQAVFQKFSATAMAQGLMKAVEAVVG